MVRAALELIIEVQTDEFWQDITTSILEDVQQAATARPSIPSPHRPHLSPMRRTRR
jgi:tRNA threonylcarbamoyladenosine modification (KEOPS) complex  Pcc1 subunit